MTNEQCYVILVLVIVVFDEIRLQNLFKFQQMFCLNKYSRFIIELQNKKLSRMTIVEVDQFLTVSRLDYLPSSTNCMNMLDRPRPNYVLHYT